MLCIDDGGYTIFPLIIDVLPPSLPQCRNLDDQRVRKGFVSVGSNELDSEHDTVDMHARIFTSRRLPPCLHGLSMARGQCYGRYEDHSSPLCIISPSLDRCRARESLRSGALPKRLSRVQGCAKRRNQSRRPAWRATLHRRLPGSGTCRS